MWRAALTRSRPGWQTNATLPLLAVAAACIFAASFTVPRTRSPGFFAAYAQVPDAAEDAAFEKVKANPSIVHLRDFLRTYPFGIHRDEASAMMEDKRELLAWEAAKEQDTRSSYATYLELYPTGAFAAEARRRAQAFDQARQFEIHAEASLAGRIIFQPDAPSPNRCNAECAAVSACVGYDFSYQTNACNLYGDVTGGLRREHFTAGTVAQVVIAEATPAPAVQRDLQLAYPAEQQPSVMGSAPPQSLKDEQTAEATKRMLDYHAAWSSGNGTALGYMRHVYADPVKFYGTLTPRPEVLADKERFARRWPLRGYLIRADSTVARCTEHVCTVSGVVDYFARSIERNRSASGVAGFTLVFQSSTWLIVEETGKVFKGEAPDVLDLVREWQELNASCRGGAGDQPQIYCSRREAVQVTLAVAGWCFGQDPQQGLDLQWHRCLY